MARATVSLTPKAALSAPKQRPCSCGICKPQIDSRHFLTIKSGTVSVKPSRSACRRTQQIPAGNLFPLSPQGEGKVQRLPLEGKLPKRSLHFVQRSSPRRLMRCFDLYSAAGVRARSFPPHPADSAGICFTSPLKGKAKVLLQPGSKRSPHSVRRSSGRTPRTRSVRLSCGKYRASSGPEEKR